MDATAKSESCLRFCFDDDTLVFGPSTTVSPMFMDFFLLDVVLRVREASPLSETTILLESDVTHRELELVRIFAIVEVGFASFPTLD